MKHLHTEKVALGSFLSVLSVQGLSAAHRCTNFRQLLLCRIRPIRIVLALKFHAIAVYCPPNTRKDCVITDLHTPLTCSCLGTALGIDCLIHLAPPVLDQHPQKCGGPRVLICLPFCISAFLSSPQNTFSTEPQSSLIHFW